MINVRFYTNKGALCMRVEGHADAAPKGEDVVCAGVSALAATLADYASIMSAHGETEREPQIRMVNGFTSVKVRPTKQHTGKLLTAFSVVTTGMKAIARNYPEYITLKLFDKSDLEGFSITDSSTARTD